LNTTSLPSYTPASKNNFYNSEKKNNNKFNHNLYSIQEKYIIKAHADTCCPIASINREQLGNKDSPEIAMSIENGSLVICW